MSIKFCPHCGVSLNGESKFCHSCGKTLIKNEKKVDFTHLRNFFGKIFSVVRVLFFKFGSFVKRIYKKVILIILLVTIVFGVSVGAYFVWDKYYKNYEFHFVLSKDYKELRLNGKLFDYRENEIGLVRDNIFVLKTCEDQTLDFVPELNGFFVEMSFRLNCKESEIRLKDDDLDLVLLLDNFNNYISAIEYDVPEYRQKALELTKNCSSGDLACYTDKIYKHFSKSIKYVGDIRDAEHIEGVKKTLETGIGDCEDIAIVISSFLENLGINTKMIFMNGHAYAMVCDLDLEAVKRFIPENVPYVYYPFNDYNYCFALDGTLGKDAYIGFDAGYDQMKFLIDPVTKQYAVLDKQQGIEDVIYVPAYISINKKGTYYPDENGTIYITGTTSKNCEKIVVDAYSEYGIMDPDYKLNNYKLGDTSFKYGIREDYNNKTQGKNSYYFTASCSGEQVVYDDITLSFSSYWDY